ncbi:hypothetical protein [Caldimonas tepidiphila]|uniref:hypothetical protein n=1 Tax=Caldimonas tepidiphila TaxID=2315841 RepID=UPI0013009BA8|nr:hypothetical protein [Caldimonas tepidiphila]
MDVPKYVRPLNRQVADAFDQLDEDAKEFYQKRAAVRQFEAGLSRLQAERLALQDVRDWLLQRKS